MRSRPSTGPRSSFGLPTRARSRRSPRCAMRRARRSCRGAPAPATAERTRAISPEIILRLLPKPRAGATLRATSRDIAGAIDGVLRIVRSGVTPSAIELIDAASLEAVRAYVGTPLAPEGAGAVLLLE